MGDYDKSLDDIIKQRNIGLKRASKNVTNKKTFAFTSKSQTGKQNGTGPHFTKQRNNKTVARQPQKSLVQMDARQKLLLKQRLKVKDARETLQQKGRLIDARQKLNQKSKIVDAREKLNKLTQQQNKTVVTKPTFKSSPLDLTRTVSNMRASNPVNTLRLSNTTLKKAANVGKRVLLSDGRLTVISRSSLQKQTISSQPTSVFARTVDSLAKDRLFQTNFMKKVSNPVSRKRQYISDESDDDREDNYVVKRINSAPKMMAVENVEVNRGLSSTLKSRLGKQVGSQQGYRLIVSNLHPLVSERDLEDLFGDIGPIFGVQILQEGVAEVIYQRLADAEKSVEVYHKRELDGRPMGVKLMNLANVKPPVVQAPSKYVGSSFPTGTLHSDRPQEVAAKTRITPDVGLFHKALFRGGSQPAVRSHAAFTVTM